MTALQWALFGDDALPAKGQDYRLHPIDWDTRVGTRVPITVEVEFEATKWNKSKEGLIAATRRYLIVRSAYETVNGAEWERSASTVKCFLWRLRGASRWTRRRRESMRNFRVSCAKCSSPTETEL